MARVRPQGAPTKNAGGAPSLPTRRPVPRPAAADPSQPPTYAPGESTEEAPPLYSEAPPSYEDTVTQEITLDPVDGVRREYAPPITAEDPLLSRDEKS